MFIDDAAPRSFERGGVRAGSVRDVFVEELLQRGALMARDHGCQHEKQPRLALRKSCQ